MPNKKKIIVSADDFGISQKANRNILGLAKSGKLDRVEVMMSQNITPKIAQELTQSGVKIDIHFHLLKENQLKFWQENSREIETGTLKRIFLFLYHLLFGDTRPKIARQEWESQIADFQKVFGKLPDGISSHEHIHFFPFYFGIINELCEKYDFSYLRLGKESFSSSNMVCLILNFLRRINLVTRKIKITSSDQLISFDWLDPKITLEELLLQIPKEKTVEIVFHPEKENELEFLEKL